MKKLSYIFHFLGPFGCVLVVLLIIILIRMLFEQISQIIVVPDSDQKHSAETVITSVSETGLLKPYKVIAAGVGNEAVTNQADEVGVLWYQYKGFAEFAVDLRKMRVNVSDNDIVLMLPNPVIESPVSLQLKAPYFWEVEPSKFDEYFRENEGVIINKQIMRDVATPEHFAKAKAQTENILINLLKQFFDTQRIKVKWDDDGV